MRRKSQTVTGGFVTQENPNVQKDQGGEEESWRLSIPTQEREKVTLVVTRRKKPKPKKSLIANRGAQVSSTGQGFTCTTGRKT